jgi:isoamylase
VPDGLHWEALVDTNQPEASLKETFPFNTAYAITGRSLVAFGLARSGGPNRSASNQ